MASVRDRAVHILPLTDLYGVLPRKGALYKYCHGFSEASVLFADLVDFTPTLSAQLESTQVVNMLQRLVQQVRSYCCAARS
jgi:class 3 adenylate cyclase